MSKRANDPHAPTLISGPKLALHSALSPSILTSLFVIERRPDGLFDQDVGRWKYLTHLRERKSSPGAAADAEFAKTKTEWLALRIAKHKREHLLASEADAVPEEALGIMLNHISSTPALLYQTDLPGHRRAEATVLQVRQAIVDEC